MIHVLIVDDHPIVRQGLKQVLEEDSGIVVTGEAGSGKEGLQLIRKNKYDAVSLDLSMPDMNGLDVLKQVRLEKPNLPVLILSIYPEEQFAIRALKAGASGYLTKTSIPDELVTAIEEIAKGHKYISSSLAGKLAADLEHPHRARSPHETLSDREYEVLRMIGQGMTISEIAGHLMLSIKTVSTHRAHILKKMELETSAQLMRYALDNKLVE